MPKINRIAIPTVLMVLTPFVALAQSPIPIPDYVDAPGAEKVVANAPYSAQRRFTSTRRVADGTTTNEESSGSDARDSQGRTYDAAERHWTYLKDKKVVLGTETLYRIEDPIANTTTRWDSTTKEAKVIHWPSLQSAADTACSFRGTPDLPRKKIEKLGDKVMQGLHVQGTRMSYIVTDDGGHNREETTIVHELWYSTELKIVILATHDDPRSMTSLDEVIDIVRDEPDVSKYQPPADYAIHKIEIPQQPPAR